MSTATYSYTPTAVGNYLFIVLTWGGGGSTGAAPTSITFSGVTGGAFSLLQGYPSAAPIDMIYGGQVTSASTATITLNWAATPTYYGWAIIEISAGGPTTWTAQGAAGFTGGGSSSSGILPSISNTSAGSAVYIANLHESVSTFSPSATIGKFQFWIGSGGASLDTSYAVVLSGVADSIAPTWTTNTATALFDGCEVLVSAASASQIVMWI